MMTRVAYHAQIRQLRDDVVAMSSMVDKAIARGTEALQRQNVSLARSVISADQQINDHRWQTEEKALLAIALQAPIARDLRVISASISIVTDLERMADHAAGIAKIAIRIADEPLLKPLVDLPRMSDLARMMLGQSMTAFINNDIDRAREVIQRDDEIDDLYNTVFADLLRFMTNDPETINRATHLLWAAHNYERMGDRVTNICERIVFSVTGNIDDLASTSA